MAVKAEELKKRLMEEVEHLPEEKLGEVLDFVGYLVTKTKVQEHPESVELDPARDPILKIIGIGDSEPIAHRIDEELYGG